MSSPVPPWLLDADEILTVPPHDLEQSPVSVRLYVGDVEARVRELETVCEWLREAAFDRVWPQRHGGAVPRRNRAVLVATDALREVA